jgi:hypothetical protein
MSTKLIGRFYFKRTDNGNLIGEFSNNTSVRNAGESAEVICSSDKFIGEFHSTWYEDGLPCLAKLKIDFKPGTNNTIYSLRWEVTDGEGYWGEGILCDGILIGDYRDYPDIN